MKRLSNKITIKDTFITSLQLNCDYIISTGSRILGKVYANVSGSGDAPVARIYVEGNTSSRWELPWVSNSTFNADTLDGLEASDFALSDHNHDSRYVNIS